MKVSSKTYFKKAQYQLKWIAFYSIIYWASQINSKRHIKSLKSNHKRVCLTLNRKTILIRLTLSNYANKHIKERLWIKTDC